MRQLPRLHNLGLPLALALLIGGALAVPQEPARPPAKGDPVQEPEETRARKWPLSSDARNEKTRKELLGAWQVVLAEHQGLAVPKGSASGYVLITEGYLSIEIHLRLPSSLPGGTGLFFQTGTHRWRLNPAGQMETSSLIGISNFTPDEQVRFQQPAEQRLWELWLDGPQVTLERPGQSRLVLRRLGLLPFPGEDPEFGFKRPVRPTKD